MRSWFNNSYMHSTRHVSEHSNPLSAADALAGGTTDPGVAESIEGRAQGGHIAVVDPAGLEPGRKALDGLDEFRQRGRGYRLRGSRRRRRRRPRGGPGRVAGDELVEHRRDVVPDLAAELAALPADPQTNQEIPGQPRGTGDPGDRRLVSFLLRRRAFGTRLRRSWNVDHPDLNRRLAGPATGHRGDVPAPARTPHGAPTAAHVRDGRTALWAPSLLLRRHESTVPKGTQFASPKRLRIRNA